MGRPLAPQELDLSDNNLGHYSDEAPVFAAQSMCDALCAFISDSVDLQTLNVTLNWFGDDHVARGHEFPDPCAVSGSKRMISVEVLRPGHVPGKCCWNEECSGGMLMESRPLEKSADSNPFKARAIRLRQGWARLRPEHL